MQNQVLLSIRTLQSGICGIPESLLQIVHTGIYEDPITFCHKSEEILQTPYFEPSSHRSVKILYPIP